MNDRVSDLAGRLRPRRHPRLGNTGVTADIIGFIDPPARGRDPTDFPTIAFRSTRGPDKCSGTAPSEYVQPDDEGGVAQCPER